MAKLWIGQPNYSSWSLRGWLICKIAELNPEIEWIRFDQDEWRDQVPSRGLVPALELESGWVWDSQAIGETLAEQAPALWPADTKARMHARSIVAEMHSGFSALRAACPMNIRARATDFDLSGEVFADISRVQDLLEEALAQFGGTFLYGESLTMADAFLCAGHVSPAYLCSACALRIGGLFGSIAGASVAFGMGSSGSG